MFNFKQRLLTHIGACAFVLASVGSGFGAWVFSSSTESSSASVEAVETDAVLLSKFIHPSFVSKSLVIQDTNDKLSGIEIRLTSDFQRINGTRTVDAKKSFSVIYSTKIEITASTDESKPTLLNYVKPSAVSEMDTVSKTADLDSDGKQKKDDNGDLKWIVTDPLELDTGNCIISTEGSETYTYNIEHPFNYNSTGIYTLDVCVFPQFDYIEDKKPTTIGEFTQFKQAINNTTFTFTFDIVDVTIIDAPSE